MATLIGPFSPSTAVDDSSYGTVAWTNPTNVYTDNNVYATVGLNNQSSHYIVATNFNITGVPGNAIITGVRVELSIYKSAGAGQALVQSLRLVKRGKIVGEDKGGQDSLATFEQIIGFGAGSTTTDVSWGLSLSPDDVQNYDFGVAVAVSETAGSASTISLDYVSISLYYESGYVAAPQVQNPNEILLFGQRYRLAAEDNGSSGKVHMTLGSAFPQKLDVGFEFARQTNPVVESYTISRLDGGIGMWHYRSPQDLNRIWDMSNGECIYPNAIAPGPYATSISQPAGESGGSRIPRIITSFGSTRLLVVLYDDRLYNHNFAAAWSVLIDTLPGAAPTDSVYFNGQMFYALGSAGYSYHNGPAVVATDVASPAIRSFVVWDNKLYALDTAGVLYSSTTGAAASWTTLASLANYFLPGNSYEFPDLVTYDDTSGDTTIYALMTTGPFVYDAVNDKWIRSRYKVPFFPKKEDIRGLGATFRESLFYRSRDNRVIKLTMTGSQLIVEDVSPSLPDGMPTQYDGGLQNWAATGEHLFVGVHARWNNTSVKFNILQRGDNGWQRIWVSDHAAGTGQVMGALAVINAAEVGSTDRNRLYFHDMLSSTNHVVSWINLDHLTQSPLQSTVRQYTSASLIDLPVFDAWNNSQTKIAQQVRIKLTGASATNSSGVTLQYRLNESTGAWTTITTVLTNGEITIPLGTNGTGIAFQSWQWRLSFLALPTPTTTPPILDHLTLDYIRKEEVLRAFEVTIDLSADYNGKTPLQMEELLWGHMKASAFGTFSYRDDTGNARSYLVKVMKPSGIIDTGTSTRGLLKLSLLEMGPN